MALPTSDTVTWRTMVTSPVPSSTSASMAVQLNSKKAGAPLERMVGLGLLAALAVADQLAAEAAEAGLEDLQDRQLAVGQPDHAARRR